MEELLNSHRAKIYAKLKKAIPNLQTTIWKNKNFRIDPRHTVNGQSNIKSWNLQLNKDADSHILKRFKGYSTHEKLYWDTFNLANPPEYDAWVRGILSRF